MRWEIGAPVWAGRRLEKQSRAVNVPKAVLITQCRPAFMEPPPVSRCRQLSCTNSLHSAAAIMRDPARDSRLNNSSAGSEKNKRRNPELATFCICHYFDRCQRPHRPACFVLRNEMLRLRRGPRNPLIVRYIVALPTSQQLNCKQLFPANTFEHMQNPQTLQFS